jgi:hypothetical protein
MEIIAQLLGFAATVVFALWVFRPVRGARVAGEKRRFQLVDFFSLVVIWQYALLFVLLVTRGSFDNYNFWSVVRFVELLTLMTGIWLGLVSRMSRLGVQRASKRFVAVALVMPVGIVAAFVFFWSASAMLYSLVTPRTDLKYSAMAGAAATLAGVACRASLQWATRPEREMKREEDALD